MVYDGGRISVNAVRTALKHTLAGVIYPWLLRDLPAPRPSGERADIAVVCLAALGDFVVFCSVARELHKQGKRIVLICRENKGIEEFAELTGYFDQIIPLSYEYRKRGSALRMLRSVGADLVIVAPMGRHTFSDLCALSISANRRVLPDTLQGCELPRLKRIIDRLADTLVPVTAVNEQERYEQYLRGAGLYNGAIMPFAFDWVANRNAPERKLIAVFPGASGGEFKRWPIDRFAAVSNYLLVQYSCKIVACGSSNEKELGTQFCALVPEAINRCGEMTIADLVSFLKAQVSLCICNDTGSAHISVACGVPTVVICGGWEYGRFYPNARLPGYCCTVLPDKDDLACVPCGKSQPDCVGEGTAICVLAVETGTVKSKVQHSL